MIYDQLVISVIIIKLLFLFLSRNNNSIISKEAEISSVISLLLGLYFVSQKGIIELQTNYALALLFTFSIATFGNGSIHRRSLDIIILSFLLSNPLYTSLLTIFTFTISYEINSMETSGLSLKYLSILIIGPLLPYIVESEFIRNADLVIINISLIFLFLELILSKKRENEVNNVILITAYLFFIKNLEMSEVVFSVELICFYVALNFILLFYYRDSYFRSFVLINLFINSFTHHTHTYFLIMASNIILLMVIMKKLRDTRFYSLVGLLSVIGYVYQPNSFISPFAVLLYLGYLSTAKPILKERPL